MIVQENLSSTPRRPQSLALARDTQPKTAMLFSSGRPWSRSELMLNAALNTDNRLVKKTNSDIVTAGAEGRSKLLLLQQASQQKKRNRVLFSEPVVTDSFEYEPTVLFEKDDDATFNSQEDNSEEPKQARSTKSSNVPVKYRQQQHQQRQVWTDQRDNCTGYAMLQDLCKTKTDVGSKCDDNGDTDDDELFTLAPSTFYHETQPSTPTTRKRPYDLTFHESNESLDCSDSEPENGCLFSPPKVAKVAPYYCEQPEAEPQTTDLKSSHSAVRARLLDFVYFLFR